LLRRISGDVFTIRFKTTLNLLAQLVVRPLKKVHLGATQGEDEFPPAQALDLGPFALGNLPLAKPLDRRGETEILDKFLACTRIIRQQSRRQFEGDRFRTRLSAHLIPLFRLRECTGDSHTES